MQIISQRTVAITLVLLFCGAFFVTPLAAFAEDAPEGCTGETIKLEVGLGDVSEVRGLNEYLAKLYQFIVSSIAILSAASIMLNGIRWAAAAGNSDQISKAKDGITAAIIGLVLAIGSYVLLNTLNPALVNPGDICPKALVVPVTGVSEGGSCAPDVACKEGLECVKDPITEKSSCKSKDARANGDPCTKDTECASGACNEKESICTAGDGSDGLGCSGENSNCESGYVCDNNATSLSTIDDVCKPATEGASCDEDSECWNGQAPPAMFCINDDDKCHDGSQGDPCDAQGDCTGDLICTVGSFASTTCQSNTST